MSWASIKRFQISSVGLLLVAIAAAGPFYFWLSKPATCVDGKHNGVERGIDCGGECAYMCMADVSAVTAKFIKAFSPSTARTDVIVYIENSNSAYTDALPYVVTLYGRSNEEIVSYSGSIALSKGITPLYLPKLYVGDAEVARAFIDFDTKSARWQESAPLEKTIVVESQALTQNTQTPKLQVVLHNTSVQRAQEMQVVATLFNSDNNVVSASATVVDEINADGKATAVFTWNEPFTSEVVRQEVMIVPHE